MYKNQLQALAQQCCFNLPAYTCLREGPDHAPRFKAVVNFDGEQFESPGFFTTLRQAEHAAAEVALAALVPIRMLPIVTGNLPPGFDSSTCRSVYVGNINLQVTDAMLQEVFQSLGPVEGCKLIRKEMSSFGFVHYYDHRSAARAILSLNGRNLYGQPIYVNWAYTCTQREDTSGHFNIFVGNLCPDVTDATLFAFFSGYSTCSDARVMWDQKTGRSRGFGFVSFRNQQDAQSAINYLNGKWLGNRQIRCNWATKGATGEEKQIVDSKVDLTKALSESGKENPNEDGPENNPHFTTVYVGNLPHEATNNDVHLFFDSLGAGSIEEVHVTRDKGFGFVRYSTHDEAALAIQLGNGQLIGGRQIKVYLRHEKEVHPNRPTLRIDATDKRDFKSHVKDMHDNREYRYTIDGVVDEPVKATVFPCLFTQYMKVADLVGNEETLNELLKIITEGTEMSMAHGKIVSIVGLGGLGKTALAHAIYRKLRAQFDCWAYVSVSRNPDMKKLFKCMLYQLGKKNNANIHEGILDERQLIYELNEFLQKRRYFIVIDDIRDILVWNMIKCALPTNDGGFIIIATTCILDVAKQVGGTYMMRPLCLQNSRILLHRKTFGIEGKDEYADEELTEISEKILQKCGGVPLAIITISGLLASKRKNKIEWYKFYDSIASVVKNSLDVESMKNILSLNYSDLPSHLRTCLLYLSVFPEGHDIDKDRLIRLWIAEGLIQCGKQEENPFELGESYFYELINRSMIQPVYKRWYYDMTECCQVHDMVLDLILYLSGKEVQWLSLQNSMVDIATHEPAVNMQEVRSVIVFPSAVKLLPALACFKVLRVLDLQSCCLSQGCSLKYLGNLFHLRYLGLRGTGIASLSEEIGKLQFLQTLDVTGNEIFSLPFTVAELKHLMCLHIDSRTGAPNGIGSFTSLEELSTLRIQDSTDIIEKLGNQTELRVLGIDCRTGWNVNRVERSLVDCLHKLQKIKTLSISMVGECNLNAWVPPRHLRKLELTGCWRSPVPALLNNASLLVELYFLSIEVRKLRQEDLESLGRLPALSYLDIEVGNQKLGIVQTFIIGARSFPCLVHCTLRGYIGPVAFQQGAMPEVARLHLVLPVREIREAVGINGGGFGDLGFGNLPRLQDVSFLLRRGGASTREVKEAEAGLRQAIESHPNHPTLEIL